MFCAAAPTLATHGKMFRHALAKYSGHLTAGSPARLHPNLGKLMHSEQDR